MSSSLILDTSVLIWWAQDSKRLSASAREVIDRAPEIYFSSVSVVELEIKRGKLGRIPDNLDDEFRRFGFAPLVFDGSHATEVGRITALDGHDPFDRMLAAQASASKLTLMTGNKHLLRTIPHLTLAA